MLMMLWRTNIYNHNVRQANMWIMQKIRRNALLFESKTFEEICGLDGMILSFLVSIVSVLYGYVAQCHKINTFFSLELKLEHLRAFA